MKKLFIAGLAWFAFHCAPGQAFNTSFLTDAPISRFNDDDIAIMLSTLTTALNDSENGVETEWKNPATDNRGSVTPLDRTVVDSRDCRTAIIRTIAGHLSGSARYLLCKADDGEWHVSTTH